LSSRFNNKYIGGLNNAKEVYPLKSRNYKYVVNDKEEFLLALKNVKAYESIFINGAAVIDLSDQPKLHVKTGVKIISDRGDKGSKGALLYTNNPKAFPLFECGSYVNFVGLRIMGNDNDIYHKGIKKGNDFRANTYGPGITQGIRSSYNNLLIENCELSGWTHTAILITGKNAKIIYSYIHHNRRHGLGYGINVDGGSATIEGNLFDYNRHSIASTGVRGSSYTVEYNVFLENGTSHVIDVHGGKDRKDNTNIAGDYFIVANNYFRLKPNSSEAFVIRGVPTKKADFSNNIIEVYNKNKSANINFTKEAFIKQNNAKGNFFYKNNKLR